MIILSVILTVDRSEMKAAPLEKATLAGGCFWCMEEPFDKLPGVVSVTSGYTGGRKKNPTYDDESMRNYKQVERAYKKAVKMIQEVAVDKPLD